MGLRCLRRSRVISGLILLLVCCALAGCARVHDARCEALAKQVKRLQHSNQNREVVTVAGQGIADCGGDSSSRYWKFRFWKAEALTNLTQYNEALKVLAPEPPNTSELGAIRADRVTDQAEVYTATGNYVKALDLLNLAEREAHRAGPAAADRLDTIAFDRVTVFGLKGDSPSALKTLEVLGRQHASDSLGPYVQVNQAFALMQVARYEEAANLFELARPAYIHGDSLSLGKLDSNLADCYYRLGDLPRALSALNKAEPLLRASNHVEDLRVCLNKLGLVYLDRGQPSEASHYLTEALQLSGDNRAKSEVLSNLARAAIAAGRWPEAASYNHRALDIKRHLNYPDAELYSLANEARIYEGLGQDQFALATLDSLIRQPYVNPAPHIEGEVEYISIYRRLHDEVHARQHFLAALQLIERTRSSLLKTDNQLAYYDSQNSLYAEWVRFLVGMGRTGEALEAAESSRGRLMLERLGRAIGKGELPHADYRRIARERRAVLVSYWVAPAESYAWVVSRDGIQICKLPGEAQIGPLVEAYRAILEQRRDPMHSDGSGERLRIAVLDPVRQLLGGATNVILVPDGPLHSINFEALPVGDRYWIDEVTLTIAPSLRVLATRNSAGPTPERSRILIIGNAEPSPDFPRLAGAAVEMNTVAGTFPGRATILNGPEASPSAYLERPVTQNYIHFAAHAAANAEQPLESAVILSSGKTGERLTARALLQKPIHADLVTISSCRSAGARSYHGEGLVGLAWVFLQTGARGVIAGLWNAPDESTCQIMAGLYTGIARGLPPAHALHAAKLALVHSSSHFHLPYYWAPFEYYAGAGAP